MGALGKEENIEEVFAPLPDVFSVLTDMALAQTWGRTDKGNMIYPTDSTLRLGHVIDVQPKGMKEACKVKVKVIHFQEYIEMELVEGPMFGIFKFAVERRPYGTLLSSVLDYRIENFSFNLKWKLGEKKKYKGMMEAVLANVKKLAEMRAYQSPPSSL